MNGALFIILITICSVVTALATEVEKKLLGEVSSNVLAMITGIVVGAAVTVLYYFFNDIAYTSTNIVYCILVCLGSGVGSMLGYDKVTQTIKQVSSIAASK